MQTLWSIMWSHWCYCNTMLGHKSHCSDPVFQKEKGHTKVFLFLPEHFWVLHSIVEIYEVIHQTISVDSIAMEIHTHYTQNSNAHYSKLTTQCPCTMVFPSKSYYVPSLLSIFSMCNNKSPMIK